MLNSHFCSVGEGLAENIDEASNPLLTGGYTINESNACFEAEEINDTLIRDVIPKIETCTTSNERFPKLHLQ